jgi:hypothetical protein
MLQSGEETRRLQAKLGNGEITEAEYARLVAIRFGEDPSSFTFEDAAAFFDLSESELREEMAWLSRQRRHRSGDETET